MTILNRRKAPAAALRHDKNEVYQTSPDFTGLHRTSPDFSRVYQDSIEFIGIAPNLINSIDFHRNSININSVILRCSLPLRSALAEDRYWHTTQ